ncbi:hypothetical protein FOA52_003257 [Chlamydomonas sp. UWO 241]|nr:hypothetical protein FOA52_003257 [Chlamydomonas sp. UWO 241]
MMSSDAEQAERQQGALSLGETVLTTALIFSELWRQVADRDDRRSLRAVSRCVRDLANGATESLEMREPGASELIAALARCPNITRLDVDMDRDCVPVLGGAKLPKLRSLSLTYEENDRKPWRVSAPSPSVAAGLQELHLINPQGNPRTLRFEAVCSFCRLESLSVLRCSLSDLKPLGACTQLRRLSLEHCNVAFAVLAQLQDCAAQLQYLSINSSAQKLQLKWLQAFSQLKDLNISYHDEHGCGGGGCDDDDGGLLRLDGIQACGQLEGLSMRGRQAVACLAPLAACVKLEVIDMASCRRVSSLAPLSASSALKDLNLYQCDDLSSLSPLSACTQLERLNVALCCSLSSLQPLSACTNLKDIDMTGQCGSNLALLSAWRQLERLNISCCSAVGSLEPLSACDQLKVLVIGRCDVTCLAPLSSCSQLKDLDLHLCSSVTGLAPLSTCGQLECVNINFCKSLRSIAPLAACSQLKRVSMGGCPKVTIQPLQACAQLKELSIEIDRNREEGPALKAVLPRLRILSEGYFALDLHMWDQYPPAPPPPVRGLAQNEHQEEQQ